MSYKLPAMSCEVPEAQRVGSAITYKQYKEKLCPIHLLHLESTSANTTPAPMAGSNRILMPSQPTNPKLCSLPCAPASAGDTRTPGFPTVFRRLPASIGFGWRTTCSTRGNRLQPRWTTSFASWARLIMKVCPW